MIYPAQCGNSVDMNFEENWEGFWRNTREAAAYRSGAPQQAALEQFWGGFFKRTLPMFPGARILDLACGNGVVARSALGSARAMGEHAVMVCGLDRSASGLIDFHRRLPAAQAVNADVLQAPFREGVFELVTSQFGVEYAGSSAIVSAARLVSPGGVLAAILHLKGGGIYNECHNNLHAMQDFESSNFMLHARQVFLGEKKPASKRTGLKLSARPTAQFLKAGRAVLEILQRYGVGVAGGVVQRLHADVSNMYAKRTAIELGAILAWIDGMSGELRSYTGRMSAMLDAALDENDFVAIRQELAANSMVIRVHEVMYMGEAHDPAAWILICDRDRGDGPSPPTNNTCQYS